MRRPLTRRELKALQPRPEDIPDVNPQCDGIIGIVHPTMRAQRAREGNPVTVEEAEHSWRERMRLVFGTR